MIKHLIPEGGNFYKANLHCHTTISDGKKSPEEVRQMYKEQGYSVVAFTDHDVFIPHPELAEEDFLPLNGFEIEINEWNKPWEHTKSCHLCFIALDPDNYIHPLWHRTDYLFANAVNYRSMVQFDPEKPDFCRSHTPECVNAAIKTAQECGFFVTYNHPRWSLETLDDYGKYVGMNAMEIYNHGCYVEGYDDYAPAVYDDILRGGQRCFCLSTDDNHNWTGPLSPHWDSFGGQIPARLSHYEAWKWKIMGLPGSAPCSENVAQKNFRDCWIKECNTLADGVLTACPRGVVSRTVFGIEKNPFEHVRVLDYQDETEAKARIALCLSQKYEKDFCRYCMGMSAENHTEVVPGEQIG